MKLQRKTIRLILIFLGLVLWLFGARATVLAFLAQPSGLLKQAVSPVGIFSLLIYAVFCLAGLGALYASLAGISESRFVRSKPAFRWTGLTTLTLYLVAVFILVYQPGLRPLLLSWFTPLFLAGWLLAVKWAARFDGSARLQALNRSDLVFGGILLVLLLALTQIKLAMPASTFWKIAFVGLLGLNGLIVVLFSLAQEAGPRYWHNFPRLFAYRKRYRYLSYLLSLVLVLLPSWWMFYYDITGIGAGLGFPVGSHFTCGIPRLDFDRAF